MGRGVLSGIVFGVLVTILGLGAVSLMLPPPKPTPPSLAAAGDAAPEISQSTPRVAAPAMPDPAPPRPADAPSGVTPDRAAGAPDASTAPGIVEVPAGSEFARGAEDMPPARPAEQPAPGAATAPEVLRPEDTPAPVQTDTEPATRPDVPGAAPVPQDMPQTESAALDEPPQAEAPVPVPPPGEVQTPALSPVPPVGAPVSDAPIPQANVEPGPELAPEPGPESAIAPEAAPSGDKPAEDGVPAAGAGVAAQRDPAAPPAVVAVPEPPITMPEPQDLPPATDEAAPAEEPEEVPGPTGITDPAEPDIAPELPRVFSPSSPAAPAGRSAGFSNAPGVRVGRLPRIGSDPLPAETTAEDEQLGLDDAGAEPLPPLRAHAQPFDRPEGKALYSVIMIDTGTAAGGLDRATLKTLGVPVTIAIDPSRADATEAARDFRAAGFEVAILAAPFSPSATPADLEVTIESWRQSVPEAIALVEGDAPVFQNNRRLAQEVVRILSREGLGLVSQDQGLNAAAQIAGSAQVPQARVWRVIDSARDKSSAIERMLGRAAFEAARHDKVTVMLSGWPQSVAGLIAWAPTLSPEIAFAPVSAVMLSDETAN